MVNERYETTYAEILGTIRDGELWRCTGIVKTQERGQEEHAYSFELTNPPPKESIMTEVKYDGDVIYEEKDGDVTEDFTDKHLLVDARAVHSLVVNSSTAIVRARKKSEDAFDKRPTWLATTESVMLRFVGYGVDSHERQVIGDITTTMQGVDLPQIFSFTTKDIGDTLTIECDGLVIYDKVAGELILNDNDPDVMGMTQELVPSLDTVINNFLVRHMIGHIWPKE